MSRPIDNKCPNCDREVTWSDDHVFDGAEWEMAMCLKRDGGCGWESEKFAVDTDLEFEFVIFPGGVGL